MKNLLKIYLKLETKLNMEYMLKEHIYITYYEKLADFKNEMFFLDDQEFIYFLDDYRLNKAKLIRDFIMFHDKKLDLYIIWTEVDNLELILSFFSHQQKYKRFII